MDNTGFVVGEYYWVNTVCGWEVCLCIEIPSYTGGVGFEQIGIEGTAYPLASILASIHIESPNFY